MNSLISQNPAEPLIFNWESPGGEKLAITICLAISVIAHALCFYIFQIVYPPTVALLPPPARIALITPDSEGGRTLLRWIEAEDPALAFTTRHPKEVTLRALPKAEHVPSYSATEPILQNIPPVEHDLRIPSSEPPGPVQFFRRKTASPITATKTSLSFSNELKGFGAPTLPMPRFVGSNEQLPETVRFRVAVSARGEVRYCFPINSSGDPALDEQARLYIARSRFPQNAANAGKPDSFLTWGTATIVWGNDIARPQPAPAARVTP
jgi:hypothetical protein